MKTIFLGISLLYSLFAGAQKNAQEKKEIPTEIAFIKMSKFPIADFPKKSIPVSGIQVIQLVRDSVNLGYAMKGMDKYIITIQSPKPLTAFLQEQVTRMYKDDFKEAGVKFLWVIKDIRVGEKTAFMEYAYTKLHADAYIADKGDLFKKICTMDTVLVIESGADVTRWHGEYIESAFRTLAKKTLLLAKEPGQLDTERMTVEEIAQRSRPKIDIPIMKDIVYKEGAYASYEEFLENKPSVTSYEAIVVDKKKIKFIGRASKDTLAVWGLCKDGEIYKYYEDVLIPIEKQGAGFIISDYVKNANKHNRNLVFLSLVGGITGGIVGGTAVSLIANAAKNKLLLVRTIPYIQNPGKQPLASCIDMATGEFSF